VRAVSGVARQRVELGERGYEVLSGPGAAAELAGRVAELAGDGAVGILVDERVAPLHAPTVFAQLREHGVEALTFPLPEGERAKTLTTVENVCRRLVESGFERRDLLIGLGGGAATDVTGFVAAVFLRGVRFVSLPTSLLAQVDAAIGGKTGVNLPEGKNLVGSFHQPQLVACEPAFLATLAEREFRCGLAEVVKTAWIGDAELFELLEADPPVRAEHAALPEVVRRCVAVKGDIVARDERETGVRARLNFGHTLGHAIETESGGRLLHGEAVALGMVAAVHASVETGRCEASLLGRLLSLLTRLGLPVSERRLDPEAIIARTRRDKKRVGGEDRYQLTEGLGSVSVAADLPEEAARAAVEFLRR
jgi:3-dehydroquinate synthase